MFPKFPATETASHILCPTHDAIVGASIVTWDEGAQRRNSEQPTNCWREKKRERVSERVRHREKERDIALSWLKQEADARKR